MSTHTELLIKAKQLQKDKLTQSAALNSQIKSTLAAIIRSNSSNDSNGPSCLDKITTIHEIDKEIDRQMNEDIAIHFDQLMGAKRKLVASMDSTKKTINYTKQSNAIDDIQRRTELVDQEFRILEATLKTIRENQN